MKDAARPERACAGVPSSQSGSDAEEALKRLARARFVLGASRPAHFPADIGAEVAFAGRSNAGKSSAINALTGRRALARVSKTPGRTRQINFFEVDDACRLVDLPGYGYAKASRAEQRHFGELAESYLHSRASLSALVLIADARRVVTDADLLLMDAAEAAQIPVHLVLAKADKLNRRESRAALAGAQRHVQEGRAVGAQLFSALRRNGLHELALRVCAWLGS